MKQALNQANQPIVLAGSIILTFVSDNKVISTNYNSKELALKEFNRIKIKQKRGRKPLHKQNASVWYKQYININIKTL